MAGNVSGLKAVIAAIQKAEKKTAIGVQRGLKRAGLFIQRESQKIVPWDLGILHGTAKTTAEGKGFDTEVRVTYGTDYAVFVHERQKSKSGKTIKHSPGKTWKYLERPIREKKREYIAILNEDIAKG